MELHGRCYRTEAREGRTGREGRRTGGEKEVAMRGTDHRHAARRNSKNPRQRQCWGGSQAGS